MESQIVDWLRRVGEVLIGLLALAISVLTLWMCVGTLFDPSPSAVSGFTLWSILAFVAGVAIALALFGVRLIIPQLRIDGRHLIGLRGLAAFAFLYGLVIVAGALSGGASGGRLIGALVLLFGVGSLIYDRLRARAPR